MTSILCYDITYFYGLTGNSSESSALLCGVPERPNDSKKVSLIQCITSGWKIVVVRGGSVHGPGSKRRNPYLVKQNGGQPLGNNSRYIFLLAISPRGV